MTSGSTSSSLKLAASLLAFFAGRPGRRPLGTGREAALAAPLAAFLASAPAPVAFTAAFFATFLAAFFATGLVAFGAATLEAAALDGAFSAEREAVSAFVLDRKSTRLNSSH